jgi:hypothetical protein
MSKKELKEMALKAIRLLEDGITYNTSEPTCLLIEDRRYWEFLIKEKILKDTRYSVCRATYFRWCRNVNKAANTFRMMMVIEFCRQNGVEL